MWKNKGRVVKILRLFLIFALIGAGFFYAQKGKLEAADTAKILISEVQLSGGSGYTDNEFIELYNPNNEPISLKGYRLVKRTKTGSADTNIKSWTTDAFIPANGYYLWANSNYINISKTPNATTTASLSDNNGVAIRLGSENTGIIIDSLAWGEAQNIFTEGLVFPVNPDDNKSIARKITNNIMQDSDNNSVDFEIKDVPDPQNISSPKLIPDGNNENTPPPDNATTTPENNSLQNNVPNNQNVPAPTSQEKKYKLGDIVINEIVSDPSDEEEEWLELYNRTNADIDLSGWTIEEGSGSKNNLTGEIAASGENKFLVVKNISGNLNNKGDIIVLRDKKGNLIDQVSYGDWNDGDLGNNAAVARDGNAVARKFDGQNSFNNLNDFAITTTPTKGKSNVISDLGLGISDLKSGNYNYSDDIIISEIFPNPKGDDLEKEFIELFNKGERDVNLASWKLEDEDGASYEFKAADKNIIKAGDYFVIYRKESKLALNNDGDQVKLFQPLKEKSSLTTKYGKGSEDWSFNYVQDKKWQWSEIITPAKANKIKTVNHPPIVDFDCSEEVLAGTTVVFDTSDTYDEDGDKLQFSWDFGDGVKNNLPAPEHTFLKEGVFAVKLTVSDGVNKISKEKIVKVVSRVLSGNNNKMEDMPAFSSGGEIIINELLPSPEGSDGEDEWIELYNKGKNSVNLLNWKLEDKSKKSFKFESDLYLKAKEFYFLERPESGISLNNSSEIIYLYNDLEKLADKIEYDKAIRGQSLARSADGKMFWTSVITPGEENTIKKAEPLNGNSVSKAAIRKRKIQSGAYVKTALENIKNFEAGDLLSINGTVAVLPGVFGVQYFYIVGDFAGIQIYNYKKDFPKLKTGDYIEVKGELSSLNGEARIKTKSAEDMKIIEQKSEPTPIEIQGDKLGDEHVGQLVKIAGEIIEKKGGLVYLDDGLGEMTIQIKRNTGVSAGDFNEGEAIAVTGIAGRTSSGIKVFPRSKDDLVLENGAGVEVLGVSSEDDEWAIAKRDKKEKILIYLLIAAGGIIFVLGGVMYRKFRRQ